MNRARLGRFRAVVGPATPHLLRATRWQPLPVSWVLAAVFLARTHGDPQIDVTVVSMLVAGGLAFVVADLAAVTTAASPVAWFDRVALRLTLAIPPSALAWTLLLLIGVPRDPHIQPTGDALLVILVFVGISLAGELWWAGSGAGPGLVGVPLLLAFQVVALQLPAKLAVYPVESHRWRWAILIAITAAALAQALRDPARRPARAA